MPGAPTRPALVGVFADGTLLARQVVPTDPPAGGIGVVRPDIRLLRFDRDGEFIDSLASMPGDEAAVLQGIVVRPGFLRNTHIAVGAATFHATAADTFKLAAYTPDGRRIRVVHKPHETERVPDAALESFEAMGIRFDPRPTYPTISAVLLDAGDNLWVKEFPTDTETPATWFVFDAAGHLLGTVSMPDRFHPYHIGSNFVLGVWRDDLDVEHVRLHRLVKAPESVEGRS